MKPRLQPPDHHVEYFLDCAVQAGELDAGSGFALRLYDRDSAVRQVIDHVPERPSWHRRARKCLDLCEIADEVMASLPLERRAGLVRAGLLHMADEMVQFAETFSNWAMDDEIDGGDLLPFRDRARARNGIPFKRTLRRLESTRFIQRYVRNHTDDARHFRALSDVCVRRGREVPGRHDPGIMRDWRAQRAVQKAIEDRKNRSSIKAERKMITRSYAVAASVLGEETVRAFLRGEEVRIMGREAALVLQKRGTLTQKGHGALSVGLAARDGTRLADLCTFIEDTPTLDQLCGFALWMQAGEERSILNKANIIDMLPGAEEHPLLRHRQRPTVENALRELRDLDPATADRIAAVIAGTEPKPRRRQLSWEQTRARNEAYFQRTRDTWIEAVLANVVGYRNFPVYRAAEAL